MIAAWRASLAEGTEVDARSFRDDIWYSGVLCGLEDDDEGEEDEEGGKKKAWVVKFKRFSSKHNERYAASGADLLRLMPVGSHTGRPAVSLAPPKDDGSGKGKRARSQAGLEEREEARRQRECGGALAAALTPALQVVGTTRSGRAVKSSAPQPPPQRVGGRKPPSQGQKKQQPAREKEGEDGEEGGDGQEQAGAEGEGDGWGYGVDTGGKDQNDWVRLCVGGWAGAGWLSRPA